MQQVVVEEEKEKKKKKLKNCQGMKKSAIFNGQYDQLSNQRSGSDVDDPH
jgi:hypothetical protein